MNTTKPIILPSPSGQFVILFWPQSMIYYLIKVDPIGKDGKNLGSYYKRFRDSYISSTLPSDTEQDDASQRLENELRSMYSSPAYQIFSKGIIDRGYGQSVTWTTTSPSGQANSLPGVTPSKDESLLEMFVVITPPKEVKTAKRRSIFRWSSSPESAAEGSVMNSNLISPQLCFNTIQSTTEGNVEILHSTVTLPIINKRSTSTDLYHLLDNPIQVFGGPMGVLCISAPYGRPYASTNSSAADLSAGANGLLNAALLSDTSDRPIRSR